MARRVRNTPAPFEVFSRRPGLGGGRGVAAEPGGPERDTAGASSSSSWMAQALDRARHPIVLRVPRGYVALLAAAVLGLVVLAYWVGYSRNPGRQDLLAGALEDLEAAGGPEPAPHPPRVPGRSYLVLATFPYNPANPAEHEAEARRCTRFLRSQGVEVGIDPVDNGGLEMVYLRGYAEDEVGTDAYYDEVGRLRYLGRIWKSRFRGPTDFAMMRLRRQPGGDPARP